MNRKDQQNLIDELAAKLPTLCLKIHCASSEQLTADTLLELTRAVDVALDEMFPLKKVEYEIETSYAKGAASE